MTAHFKIRIPKEERASDPCTRRFFCGKALQGLFLAVLPAASATCTNEKPAAARASLTPDCDDLSDLPESDLKLRKSLAYVAQSPLPESTCANCNLWLPVAGNIDCGGCTLFKGGVRAQGYCTYWAPQEQ